MYEMCLRSIKLCQLCCSIRPGILTAFQSPEVRSVVSRRPDKALEDPLRLRSRLTWSLATDFLGYGKSERKCERPIDPSPITRDTYADKRHDVVNGEIQANEKPKVARKCFSSTLFIRLKISSVIVVDRGHIRERPAM
jgi:hypothetical protein